MELEKFRERSARGKRYLVERGRPLVGWRAPFGYRWRDAAKTGWEIDPATAPIVTRIFADLAGGVTLGSLVAALEAEGVPTPTGGGHWHRSTLAHLAHNPAYCGRPTAYRTQMLRVRGQSRPRPRDLAEQVPLPAGVAPVLVEPAVWDAVHARLTRNQEQAARNNRHPEDYLLRGGYAVCGHCDRPLHATRCTGRKGGALPRYECPSAHGPDQRCPEHPGAMAHTLDAAVWGRVSAFLADPARIAAEVACARAADPTTADLATVERALGKVERQRSNLTRAIAHADDDEVAAPLLGELRALGAQVKVLQAEREVLATRHERAAANTARLEDLVHWCRQVGANLGALDYAGRRLAIEALGLRVALWREGTSTRWEVTGSAPLPLPASGPTLKVVYSTRAPARW